MSERLYAFLCCCVGASVREMFFGFIVVANRLNRFEMDSQSTERREATEDKGVYKSQRVDLYGFRNSHNTVYMRLKA